MKTVCLLSGGLDSTVTLALLREEQKDVLALSVDYGQRHHRELASAQSVANYYGVPLERVQLPNTLLAGSSLTGAGSVPEGHYADPSMRLTVVPARNTVLLAVAAAVAVREGAEEVAYGAHSGDHAIYPDCRPEFVSAFTAVLKLCDYSPLRLSVPFLNRTKDAIVAEGDRLKVPFADTWTCYKGGQRHCGKCGSCVERKEAFLLAGVSDPTEYED